MKKIALCILLVISLSLCGCDLFINQEKYDEIYEDGYNDGYDEGRIDGALEAYDEFEKLEEVYLDEIVYLEDDVAELQIALDLLFYDIYDGRELKNGETWQIDDFIIRLHIEPGDPDEQKYNNARLYFDIKLVNKDIKDLCDQYEFPDDFAQEFPVQYYSDITCRECYDSSSLFWTATPFYGEDMWCTDDYTFTSDGYLTDWDWVDYDSYCDHQHTLTLYMLFCVNGKFYAATYNIDNIYK